jgi:hypothetical protein
MTEPRAAVPHAEILAAAVDAAEESGFLPRGGVYGTLTMPDPVSGACCDGSAVKGPQYCTCWTPRFDLEQQPPVEGEPGTRTAMCADCAYRPGSPERQGDERYNGDPEFLDRIVVTGEMFFCHAGIRQAVKLVHPSGAEVDLLALAPGDYRPPIADGIPYKADGSPGDLCAGWAARRAKFLMTTSPLKRTGGTDHPSAPPVPESVPGAFPPAPGADSGKVEHPQAPSRATAAAAWLGGRGTPSRTVIREGTAAPGSGMPGAAQSPEGGASEHAPASPSGSTARTWTMELPAGLGLLSLNGREHWAARNRAAQALKKAAWAMTVSAKVPRLERIGVRVLYDPPDRRRRDHDNLAATLKPLIDGIVAAGVVGDDDTGHVAPPRCEITGTVYPRGRLRIVITEAGAA